MANNMELFYLLLPASFVLGWYLSRKFKTKLPFANSFSVPNEYFRGLNYLINEEQDKAIAVFLQMLEHNPDVVETHIALGALFRRRGETARAITIHKNLIQQNNLTQQQRTESLMELGRDYMSAGLLDRAEIPFKELSNIKNFQYGALKNLNEIYDKEQDWGRAIDCALKLDKLRPDDKWNNVIANYHCEKALTTDEHDFALAEKCLQEALRYDNRCVRANIIWADLLKKQDNLTEALAKYQNVGQQRPEYMSEVLPSMLQIYQQVANDDQIIAYLENLMDQYPSTSVLIALINQIKIRDGVKAAEKYLIGALRQKPSVRGLELLVNIYSERITAKKDKLQIAGLITLIHQLREEKPTYKCTNCGFQARQIHWQCPGCRSWGTITPTRGIFGE